MDQPHSDNSGHYVFDTQTSEGPGRATAMSDPRVEVPPNAKTDPVGAGTPQLYRRLRDESQEAPSGDTQQVRGEEQP